jgi:acyl carrier protein
MNDVDAKIRAVLEIYGRLPVSAASLKDDDDLYQNGLTSHASVNVMLALEDAFDVEFPDSMVRRVTFKSVAALREALETMGVAVEVVEANDPFSVAAENYPGRASSKKRLSSKS